MINNGCENKCSLCGSSGAGAFLLYRLPTDAKNRVYRVLCKKCAVVLRGLAGELGTGKQYELRGYLFHMQAAALFNE